MPKAYTNRPYLSGKRVSQEDATSPVWEYAPETGVSPGADTVPERAMPTLESAGAPPAPMPTQTQTQIPPRPPGNFDIELGGEPGKGLVGGQYRGEAGDLISALDRVSALEEKATRGAARMAPPGTRPAEDYTPIDTSPDGEERFRKQVIQSQLFGIDPYTIDPSKDMEKTLQEQLPAIFQHFFHGQILWEDRDKLNSEEKKQWESKLKYTRSAVYNLAKDRKDSTTKLLEDSLSRWRNRAKGIDENAKKRDAKPDTIETWNDKGKYTVHAWDPAKKQFIDTGKSAMKPSDVRAEQKAALEAGAPKEIDPAVKGALSFIQSTLNKYSPEMGAFLGGLLSNANSETLQKNSGKLREAITAPTRIPPEFLPTYKTMVEIVEDYFTKYQASIKPVPGSAKKSAVDDWRKYPYVVDENTGMPHSYLKDGAWHKIQAD